MPPKKKDDTKSAKKEDPADTLANQLESERQNLVSQQVSKCSSVASRILPWQLLAFGSPDDHFAIAGGRVGFPKGETSPAQGGKRRPARYD